MTGDMRDHSRTEKSERIGGPYVFPRGPRIRRTP